MKSLARNILGFVGISPVSETLIGGAEGVQRWLDQLHKLSRDAS